MDRILFAGMEWEDDGGSIQGIMPDFFFLRNTVQTQTFRNACTLITLVNTRTQSYFHEHLRETEPADPRNWQSHHWRLAIQEHVVYH